MLSHQIQDKKQEDQGFCLHQQEHYILPRQIYQLEPLNANQKNRIQVNYHSLVKQPKVRLKLISNMSMNKNSVYYEKSKLFKHEAEKQSVELFINSTNLTDLKEKKILYQKKIIPRDCIQFQYEKTELNKIKQLLVQSGVKIVWEEPLYGNTYRFINMITSKRRDKSFLKSILNAQIRRKIIKFNQYESNFQYDQNGVVFRNAFESANLALVSFVGPDQYDLYIRIDTNTKGHQNWYSFKIQANCKKVLKFNICNLKRQFSLYTKGLKPFVYNSQQKIWLQSGQNITYTQRTINQIQYFCLSFQIELKEKVEYHISLLPTFTYSDMLEQIENLQRKNKLQIQNLGLTLTGLAIPVVTIQNRNSIALEKDKNIILISGRIHPGQSVGSFIVKGIIKKLVSGSEDILQFLENNIVKIIPMLNPDGVVFGNFRTSALGVDLNRCFNKQDQVLYPQVVILKRYGNFLRQKYKDRFLCYFDIHGHSTKKNIFVYGPQYPINMNQYYLCRMIPKILDKKCKYFRYAASSFKLQDCKINTARGYFLKNLKVMAYTLESSYGLYDDQKQTKLFKIQDWIECGTKLVESIHQYLTLSKYSKIQTTITISTKKVQPPKFQTNNIGMFLNKISLENQTTFFNKHQKQKIKIFKNLKNTIQKELASQNGQTNKQLNSDSEEEDQDYCGQQRVKIQKKIYLRNLGQNNFLPKISEKPIIYPLATSQVFNLYEDQEKNQLKIRFLQNRKMFPLKQFPEKREKIIKHLEKMELIQLNNYKHLKIGI